MSKRFLSDGDVRAEARRAAYDVTGAILEEFERSAKRTSTIHAWKMNGAICMCAVVMGESIAYNYWQANENRTALQDAIKASNMIDQTSIKYGDHEYAIYDEWTSGKCVQLALIDFSQIKIDRPMMREALEERHLLHPVARWRVPTGCEPTRK